MNFNKYPGKLITFEGLDGSGQSTQADLLALFLRKKRYLVVLTKEPTLDSQAGKKIRRILDKEVQVEPAELQQLFAQDRKEHLENLIIPNLKKGKIVISVRYFLSSPAFGSPESDMEWLIKLNSDFILPDITFILDVPPEVCLERIKKRGKTRHLFEEKAKMVLARENYRLLSKQFINTYWINGNLPEKEAFKQIKEVIEKNNL